MGTVYFEDVEVGYPYWGTELVADEQEMLSYGQKFDPWPMHADPEAAAESPFGGLVASGGYTISLWYLSAHGFMAAPGSEWAFLGGLEWIAKFPKPLLPGTRGSDSARGSREATQFEAWARHRDAPGRPRRRTGRTIADGSRGLHACDKTRLTDTPGIHTSTARSIPGEVGRQRALSDRLITPDCESDCTSPKCRWRARISRVAQRRPGEQNRHVRSVGPLRTLSPERDGATQ